MVMTKASRPAIRTLRGWAISVLLEAGAIRECEEHGPHARERAFDMARYATPPGVSPRPPRLRSRKSWTALATPALNVRPETKSETGTSGSV